MARMLPWHANFWDSAPAAPAVLLVGEAGNGRDELALALALRLVESDEARHPDIVRVEAEAEKSEISTRAAQAALEVFALAPVAANARVLFVAEADRLNKHAANRLLKTLEEPRPRRFLILTAPSPQNLPATIVSRCRLLRAPAPTPQQARAHMAQSGKTGKGAEALLAFCGGLPLTAEQTPEETPQTVARLLQAGGDMPAGEAAATLAQTPQWEDAAQKWAADAARVACGLPPSYFPAYGEALRRLAQKRPPLMWLDFYRWLLQRRALRDHPLAKELFAKEILHVYKVLCAR